MIVTIEAAPSADNEKAEAGGLLTIQDLLAANLAHVTRRKIEDGYTIEAAEKKAKEEIIEFYKSTAANQIRKCKIYKGLNGVAAFIAVIGTACYVFSGGTAATFLCAAYLFGRSMGLRIALQKEIDILNKLSGDDDRSAINIFRERSYFEEVWSTNIHQKAYDGAQKAYDGAQRKINKRYGKPNSDPAATLG